jgi:hypothetical protein
MKNSLRVSLRLLFLLIRVTKGNKYIYVPNKKNGNKYFLLELISVGNELSNTPQEHEFKFYY